MIEVFNLGEWPSSDALTDAHRMHNQEHGDIGANSDVSTWPESFPGPEGLRIAR